MVSLLVSVKSSFGVFLCQRLHRSKTGHTGRTYMYIFQKTQHNQKLIIFYFNMEWKQRRTFFLLDTNWSSKLISMVTLGYTIGVSIVNQLYWHMNWLIMILTSKSKLAYSIIGGRSSIGEKAKKNELILQQRMFPPENGLESDEYPQDPAGQQWQT